MASQALELHNTARAKAQGGSRPSLTWSDDLTRSAQEWANHIASIGRMDHARTDDGENIYSSAGNNPSLAEAVDAWVAEGPLYHGETIGEITREDFNSVGHYTQVIWPETTEVGMASARGANGWTYIVGRYRTAGNVDGLSAWRPGPPGGSNGGGGGGGGSGRGGFYLVNSYRGAEKSSGVAWYNSLGGNDGKMPDKYVDIKRGDTVWWEGNTNSATFKDKIRITANLKSAGEIKNAEFFTQVGTATVDGKGHGVYKDKPRVLYTVDGWEVMCLYYG